MSKTLLDVRSITMKFGGLKAVDSLDLKISEGELIGLIGPNGAGKTTAFNMFTGVYQPSFGEIFFNGHALKNLKPNAVSRCGLARTFQNIRLFKELTVLENILIASHQHFSYSPLAAICKTPNYEEQEKHFHNEALQLLNVFHLENKAHELAGSLPYGEQRKLEIVRAMATHPKMILLDEPAAGMNHNETDSLMHTIAHIREKFKLTVLLIEHDMKLVMGICERIAVLDHGVKIAEGSPKEIQNDPKVIEAYLGGAT